MYPQVKFLLKAQALSYLAFMAKLQVIYCVATYPPDCELICNAIIKVQLKMTIILTTKLRLLFTFKTY